MFSDIPCFSAEDMSSAGMASMFPEYHAKWRFEWALCGEGSEGGSVYVCVPAIPEDGTAYREWVKEQAALLQKRGGYTKVVTPFDVIGAKSVSADSYVARRIGAMLKCDNLYLSKGYQNSRACMAELEVAKIFSKGIIKSRLTGL